MTKSKILGFAAVGVLSFTAASNAALVAGFNFNSLTIAAATTPGTGTAPSSVAASSGSGTLDISTFGGTVQTFGGTTVNAVGSDVAGVALAFQGGGAAGATTFPGNGTFTTVSISLTGLQDPIFSFAGQRTASGFNSDQIQYSTDGTTFTNFGSTINLPTAFATQTVDLSSINALDNASTAFIRVVFNGGTTGTGNNRIDNVQINATPIVANVPEPTTLAALAGFAVLGLRRRSR